MGEPTQTYILQVVTASQERAVELVAPDAGERR